MVAVIMATEDDVVERMQEIQKILENSEVEEEARRKLLDEVRPFIDSGNAGFGIIRSFR